jgi:hypothetical protein
MRSVRRAARDEVHHPDGLAVLLGHEHDPARLLEQPPVELRKRLDRRSGRSPERHPCAHRLGVELREPRHVVRARAADR